MYDNTNAIGLQTIYVRLTDFLNGLCPYCSSAVDELYPSSGHSFQTLDGWVNMVVYWYECTNPACTGPGRFKAPQPYVLPYKKFGQDVWVFIIQEWERFKTNPAEISQRMGYMGVIISEQRVRDILDEYMLLKDGMVDEETAAIVKKQGRIIIGCDGTPTWGGKESFWTFYDVLSGRLLHAELLHSADRDTLFKIFKSIDDRHGVEVTGFLSDHQNSIVQACMAFDPSLPHQTCHFHYLRNHWTFIELKDTHLNKLLQKEVNGLSIMEREYNGGTFYSIGHKVEKNRFFLPLIKLLKKAVNHQTEEFDKLKGIKAHDDLALIIKCIDAELEMLDPNLRPVIQLKACRDQLHQTLENTRGLYEEVKELDGVFQTIRATINQKDITRTSLERQLESMYTGLWKEHKVTAGYHSLEELKTVRARYSLDNATVLCQWRRLWDSHRSNLFHYLNVAGMERTNIYNEQLFSQLKRQVSKTSGKAHESYMVFTRGNYRVADISSSNTFTVHEVLARYDLKHLRALKEPLNVRKSEALSWHGCAHVDTRALAKLCEMIRERGWEETSD